MERERERELVWNVTERSAPPESTEKEDYDGETWRGVFVRECVRKRENENQTQRSGIERKYKNIKKAPDAHFFFSSSSRTCGLERGPVVHLCSCQATRCCCCVARHSLIRLNNWRQRWILFAVKQRDERWVRLDTYNKIWLGGKVCFLSFFLSQKYYFIFLKIIPSIMALNLLPGGVREVKRRIKTARALAPQRPGPHYAFIKILNFCFPLSRLLLSLSPRLKKKKYCVDLPRA